MSDLLFFDDYASQPDFKAALRTLATGFRQELDLPPDLDELGLVCADVVEAADHLQKTYPGMGTFMLAEGSPARFDVAGEPHPYRTRVGFAYYKDVLIELAEAGTGSDIFSTHLDPGGRITIHHMGYFSRGDDHRIGDKTYAARLQELGYTSPEWEAKVFAGMTIHVNIYDTYAAADNLSLEFLDFRLLGLPVSYPREGAELFAEAQVKWGPRVLFLPSEPMDGLRAQWSLHGSADFTADRDELWDAITDPAALSTWLPGSVALVTPGSDGGADSEGAVCAVEMTLGSAAFKGHETVTEAKPGLLIRRAWSDSDVFSQAESIMTLTADGDQIELVWQLSFVPAHWLEGPRITSTGDAWMSEALERLGTYLAKGRLVSHAVRVSTPALGGCP